MKYLKWIPGMLVLTIIAWGIVSAQEPPKEPPKDPAPAGGDDDFWKNQPPGAKGPVGPGRGGEPGKGPGGQGAPGMQGGPNAPMPGGPGQNRPMPQHQLTEEERKQAMDFLQEFSPDRIEHLKRLEKKNPAEYNDFLAKAFRQMKDLSELKKTNPDIYEDIIKRNRLESQSMDLSKAFRETDDAKKKEELKAQLQSLLTDLFDLREKEKEREIKKLETQLNELKAMYQKRKENKAAIIEDRLKELTGDKETMKW